MNGDSRSDSSQTDGEKKREMKEGGYSKGDEVWKAGEKQKNEEAEVDRRKERANSGSTGAELSLSSRNHRSQLNNRTR